MNINRIADVAEGLGWSFDVYKGQKARLIRFGQTSPAGEDFSFDVETDSDDAIVDGVRLYARDFDVEAHARSNLSLKGAPHLKELVKDAEAIRDMICELAESLGCKDL